MNGSLRADPEPGAAPVVVLPTSAAERDEVEAYNLHVAGHLLGAVTFTSFCETMASSNEYRTMVGTP